MARSHIDATPESILEQAEEIVANRDPWKHRADGMRCATCMWFVLKKSEAVTAIGRCRKRAPTMNGYPVVYPQDWCGDHKLDEEKL